MVLDINIKINRQQIEADLLKEIKSILYKNIPRIQKVLNDKIEQIVFQRLITGVPTITSRDIAEIGVPDINNRLASIIRVASQSVEIKVTKGNILRIDIGILRDDYSDLLSLAEATFQYTSFTGSGILPWLRWLLLDGGSPVIGGFDFAPLPSIFSRTGGGIMTPGGNWNIPANLAGTSNNNILTRALTNIQKDLESIIKQELQRVIK